MKELEDLLKLSTKIPLSKKTVLNLTYSSYWMKDLFAGLLKSFDLSHEQYNVLRILRGQKGKPTNLQDIQDRMINKMSNTTRLVDKLILKELVERYTCERNRRKVEIFITKKGLALLKEIDPVLEGIETSVTNKLNDDELATLNLLLTKLRS